jgi:hypothetical protein
MLPSSFKTYDVDSINDSFLQIAGTLEKPAQGHPQDPPDAL